MQDRVGNVIPTEKEILALVEEIHAVEEKVKKYTVVLTSAERSGTTKMRTGGEDKVQDIANLVDAHGLTLPKITSQGMLADLVLAKRLRPLAKATASLAQRLADTELQAESECWWAATAFYTSLVRISGAEAALEKALEPLIEFFAVGRRKAKEEPKPA